MTSENDWWPGQPTNANALVGVAGVRIDPKRQDEDYGRFAWVYDPEGNKIELWEPKG